MILSTNLDFPCMMGFALYPQNGSNLGFPILSGIPKVWLKWPMKAKDSLFGYTVTNFQSKRNHWCFQNVLSMGNFFIHLFSFMLRHLVKLQDVQIDMQMDAWLLCIEIRCDSMDCSQLAVIVRSCGFHTRRCGHTRSEVASHRLLITHAQVQT